MKYLKRFNESFASDKDYEDYIKEVFSELLNNTHTLEYKSGLREGSATITINLKYGKEAYWGENLKSTYKNRAVVGYFGQDGVYDVYNDRTGYIYSCDKNKSPDTEELVDILDHTLYKLSNSTEYQVGFFKIYSNRIIIYLGELYLKAQKE